MQDLIVSENTTVLKTFFSKENNINGIYDGYTPLSYAVKKNVATKVIDFLIENGATIDLPNKSGKTPLMYAVKYKRNNLLECLIKKGANPNFKNKKGINALAYAIKYENAIGFKKLVDLGADVNATIFGGKTTVKELAKEEGVKEILAVLGLKYELKYTTDGPYVFNKGEEYIVLSSNPKLENPVQKNRISAANASVKVVVDNKEEDSFWVKIAKEDTYEPSRYEAPEKLLAISDIEGNFYAFKTILQGAKVIDEEFNWSFGKGHLVLVGDFFDRGTNVTAVLWLIYKLDQQAKQVGGKVHFIMGNHENMNLRGDFRYVQRKYKDVALALKMDLIAMYSKNTVLGAWLRTKNCVEQIGNTTFVHAGLSKRLVNDKFSIEEINELAKEYYGKPKEQILKNKRAKIVLSSNEGPLWYRGYFKEKLPQSEIDYIASYYKTKHIVVGHTPVKEIQPIYAKKVIAIDLKHPINKDKGAVTALWIENEMYYQIDETGKKEKLF